MHAVFNNTHTQITIKTKTRTNADTHAWSIKILLEQDLKKKKKMDTTKRTGIRVYKKQVCVCVAHEEKSA